MQLAKWHIITPSVILLLLFSFESYSFQEGNLEAKSFDALEQSDKEEGVDQY